ncbi:hypothetical protein P9112_012776 [Eukaryota sp. TZLM1-RC]
MVSKTLRQTDLSYLVQRRRNDKLVKAPTKPQPQPKPALRTRRPLRTIRSPPWEATSKDLSEAAKRIAARSPSCFDPFVPLEIKNAHPIGLGVFASDNISRGSLLLEYMGERISWKDGEEILINSDSEVGYVFFVEYKSTKFALDATEPHPCWGYGRYVNHSYLNPNVKSKVVPVNRIPRLVFFACRDISKGEQLFVDYGDRTSSLPWLLNS